METPPHTHKSRMSFFLAHFPCWDLCKCVIFSLYNRYSLNIVMENPMCIHDRRMDVLSFLSSTYQGL